VEYTGQSNTWIDRKTFKHWYFHTFVSVSERTFPQDWHAWRRQIHTVTRYFQRTLSWIWNAVGNYSALYLLQMWQPLHHEVIQNMKCYYWQGFLHKLVNHEGTVKDFQCTTLWKMQFSA
jgi:hypothetical protein